MRARYKLFSIGDLLFFIIFCIGYIVILQIYLNFLFPLKLILSVKYCNFAQDAILAMDTHITKATVSNGTEIGLIMQQLLNIVMLKAMDLLLA